MKLGQQYLDNRRSYYTHALFPTSPRAEKTVIPENLGLILSFFTNVCPRGSKRTGLCGGSVNSRSYLFTVTSRFVATCSCI